MKPTLVFDMEVYQNYTLLFFKHVESKKVTRFELPLDGLDLELLVDLITIHTLVTFNGTGYDLPLLALILRGDDSLKIKKASDRIIVQNLRWWHFEKEFNVKCFPPEIDHIDLMEVAPLTGSLKLYAGRLNSKSLQDLPINPSAVITDEQKIILRAYCENDCDSTIDLYNALKSELALRVEMSKTYGIDLRSKSDAQCSEAVIKKEVETITKHRLEQPGQGAGDKFHYKVPAWMTFRTIDILPAIRTANFVVSDKGGILMPPELKDRKIPMSKGVYRMGIGGLHSSETKQVVKADRTHLVMDFDVTSYYPSIVLNQSLYPKHIGPVFLQVYRQLIQRRLDAKNRAAELKKEIAALQLEIQHAEDAACTA